MERSRKEWKPDAECTPVTPVLRRQSRQSSVHSRLFYTASTRSLKATE